MGPTSRHNLTDLEWKTIRRFLPGSELANPGVLGSLIDRCSTELCLFCKRGFHGSICTGVWEVQDRLQSLSSLGEVGIVVEDC